MSADSPSASFIIINKDDRGVADTLRSLSATAASASLRAEIVVVDASEGRLDDVRDAHPEVRWVRFTPNPAKPTIPEQRNAGVRSSTGDIVVFVDASCVPQPGWLEHLLRPILEEGESIVAGGHRSSGSPGIRDEVERHLGGAHYLREAPTINLAIRRDAFERVGTFDESFAYGSDVDFTWRANDAGLRIRYAPDAVVEHDWGSMSSDLRRSWVYGQARFNLYAKHRRRRRDALRDDPTAIVYPLFLLLLPIALVWRSILALLAVPLIRNRGKRPFLTVAHHLAYGAGVLHAAQRRLRAVTH